MSLKKIARNIKHKRSLYSDTTSKLRDDLGLLLEPRISTALPVMSCVNFVIVLIRLAVTTNIYCKMLVLARSIHALELLATTTTSIPPEPPHNYYFTSSPLLLIIAILLLCYLFIKYQRHSNELKRLPHTKITVVFFGANDYIPVDISHTGSLAKDLKLQVPPNVQTPVTKSSFFCTTVYIQWESMQ